MEENLFLSDAYLPVLLQAVNKILLATQILRLQTGFVVIDILLIN